MRNDGRSAEACRQAGVQRQDLLLLLPKMRGTLPKRARAISGGSGYRRHGKQACRACCCAYCRAAPLHLSDGSRNRSEWTWSLSQVRHGPRTDGFRRHAPWRRAARSRVRLHAQALVDQRGALASRCSFSPCSAKPWASISIRPPKMPSSCFWPRRWCSGAAGPSSSASGLRSAIAAPTCSP